MGGAVFGISLNELMTTRENDREVPFIMEKTISWLIDNNAAHVEGLFRISGMMTEMQHYRNMCDQVRASSSSSSTTSTRVFSLSLLEGPLPDHDSVCGACVRGWFLSAFMLAACCCCLSLLRGWSGTFRRGSTRTWSRGC